MTRSATCMALLDASLAASGSDYHVSLAGDDGADGLSPERAWRSLARVPMDRLQPGDRVLLRGGDRFAGHLTVSRSGSADRPIVIASYGAGRAAIAPAPGVDALRVLDAGWLVIRDLQLEGPGAATPASSSGLLFDAQSMQSQGIAVRNLRSSDFPDSGIRLWSASPAAGFSDILIEDCDCSGSGGAGMSSWGPTDVGVHAFRRVTVRHSIFHGNRGRPAKRDNHSGNGIVLCCCQDALIADCSAWANGDLCYSTVGGPVGIWLCESDRSVIRGCLSYRNRTGAGIPDGGGFDLDGGCSGCVIEDSLSWGNDGAGYLVCQYKDARRFDGNVVRNCLSIGDGRGTINNGGVFLWSDPAGDLHRTLVAHCTVIMDNAASAPAAVRLTTPADGLELRNNCFVALDGAGLLREPAQPGVGYGGNLWHAAGPASEAAFAVPVGDQLADPQLPALSGPLPSSIDAGWCAGLAPAGASPLLRSAVPLAPMWQAILAAATCVGAMPDHAGARPLAHYGA